MEKDRRANAVLFGFDFQVNAAIVLMLENIKELQYLRLESENEDIDIELYSGNHILAQAKAIVNSSTDFTNVRSNLKKALESLSEGTKKVKTEKLILITNSPNPLNEEASLAYSGDRHAVASARCQNHHKRLFPAICRKLINLWIRTSLLFRLSRLKPMMK